MNICSSKQIHKDKYMYIYMYVENKPSNFVNELGGGPSNTLELHEVWIGQSAGTDVFLCM